MKPIQLGGIAVKCHPLVVFVIPTAAVFGLLDVLLLSVISLGIHEFAHLIFAKRLGVRVIELEILPIGCVARIDPDSLAISRDELFIALAGPISSLSMGITLYAVFGILEIEAKTATQLIGINLILCFINLIPALPLDGGRVLRSLIASRTGYSSATKLSSYLGVFIGICISALGIYTVITDKANITIFVVGLTIVLSALSELKSVSSTSIKSITMRAAKIYSGRHYRTLTTAMKSSTRAHDAIVLLSSSHYNVICVVDDDMKRIGEIDEGRLLEGISKYGSNVTLKELCVDRYRLR